VRVRSNERALVVPCRCCRTLPRPAAGLSSAPDDRDGKWRARVVI
jgi:hypothetical protein